MSTERRAGSVIWAWIATAVALLQRAASPSVGVIVRNNPPYEHLLVGAMPGAASLSVVVRLLYVSPSLVIGDHLQSTRQADARRCGRCCVVSRRPVLVRPQCHRRPLAPTTSSGSPAWGWVQHCHLSSSGSPVPTIHPASSCSQGWRRVGCRTSPSAWNCCFEQMGSQWRVTNYFCRQYSPCQYPADPSSCFVHRHHLCQY